MASKYTGHPKGRTYDPEIYRYRKIRERMGRGRPDCSRCGKAMLFRGDEGYSPHHPDAFTAHHVLPLARGGSITGPIVPMCWKCNRDLGDAPPPPPPPVLTRAW